MTAVITMVVTMNILSSSLLLIFYYDDICTTDTRDNTVYDGYGDNDDSHIDDK